MINICQECGKRFESVSKCAYCSSKCRYEKTKKETQLKRAREFVPKTCEICGKPIEFSENAFRQRKKYCSQECKIRGQILLSKTRNLKEIRKKCEKCGETFRTKNPNKNICPKCSRKKEWPITSLIVYLCHKWRLEGMEISEIAKVYDCTEKMVSHALDTPLTRFQVNTINTYFNPRGKNEVHNTNDTSI